MHEPYRKYEWPGFVPHPKWLKSRKYSCGGAALGFITGIDPNEMLALKGFLPKGADKDWKTPIVLGALSKLGYYTFSLPRYHHIDRSPIGYYTSITPIHVVLAVIGIDSGEWTWCVFHDGKLYHLNDIFKGIPAFEVMLNCPISEMYLVYPKCNKERLGTL